MEDVSVALDNGEVYCLGKIFYILMLWKIASAIVRILQLFPRFGDLVLQILNANDNINDRNNVGTDLPVETQLSSVTFEKTSPLTRFVTMLFAGLILIAI